MTTMIDRQCGSQGVDADGHCTRCGLVPESDTECPPGFLVGEPGFVISNADDARAAMLRLLYEAFLAGRKTEVRKLSYEAFAYFLIEWKGRVDDLNAMLVKALAREA